MALPSARSSTARATARAARRHVLTTRPTARWRRPTDAHGHGDPDAGAAFTHDRSRWGGDATRTWAASGRFRTAKVDGRWWLVDPDGHRFFSAGLDSIRAGEETVLVPGMSGLVTELAERGGLTAACWSRNNHGQEQCSLARANLIGSFGQRWRSAWAELTAGHLRSWGFNTVGNWSDRGFI